MSSYKWRKLLLLFCVKNKELKLYVDFLLNKFKSTFKKQFYPPTQLV